MQDAIITKLRGHLVSGIRPESDVVYLLVEIGKYLEPAKDGRYPLLRFYRNWVAHNRINDLRLAGEILAEMDAAVALWLAAPDDTAAGAEAVIRAISTDRFRGELHAFCEGVQVPTCWLQDGAWREFVGLLLAVLTDVPLVITGSAHLRGFAFIDLYTRRDGPGQVAA